MDWDLCSNPPWVPFYPYTMFQNPMPKPYCQNIKIKHNNSKSTCHTKFSHSALRSAYPKTYMHRFSSLFKHFSLYKLTFFSFLVRGSSANSQKFHILLILTWKTASKWLEWYVLGWEVFQIQWHRFWVSMISGSWKIKISGKNFTFSWSWLGNMHRNGLSGTYLGFEACWIQWLLFWVSTISGSWKIKI